ncbi:hypothetical protein [Bosea sp. (in: a-proteobacteria)]|jgi:hypothetical protein|uniref:hypothetical protein n=1 Tax=Bosea sp. (in: a-proteobacteria) TaxID=1871050 RepID=UPI003F6FF11C
MSQDPDQRLRLLAEISTARACGFSGLAILCLMVGLSANLAATLKAGGYCALLVTAVLLLLAQQAAARPFKRTELWLMLDEAERPPAPIAQDMLAGARRAAFLRFAAYHAAAAAVLLTSAFLIAAGGHG